MSLVNQALLIEGDAGQTDQDQLEFLDFQIKVGFNEGFELDRGLIGEKKDEGSEREVWLMENLSRIPLRRWSKEVLKSEGN